MNQTFIVLRFEQIEKRFKEIDTLLNLAANYEKDRDKYQALCRSAHILLVSHFEGLYKEVCRDIIDDINFHTNFIQVKKPIFDTHCRFFIHTSESSKAVHAIKAKLWDAFRDYKSELRFEPFIFVDNKNPAPDILESILQNFGVKGFFWSLDGSDLDVVFEDQKSKTQKIRNRLLIYLIKTTSTYPYTTDKSIYNPNTKQAPPKTKTLWQDFLNNFLKERHNIVHGHITDNPNSHEALQDAKLKIEILLYAFIINICSAASPVLFLTDGSE